MGTTAQKIQYLDGTKTLLKDTINLTGAGITNDTFRSYANKLKLGLINALNDNGDTIYSNLEKVSGKGSNLSLTPTYEAPMRNREIYGNTLQDGTPTPSSPVPIQSVTGLQNVTISNSDNTDSNTYEVNLTSKNLFNDYGIVTATNRGITRCNVDDGIFIDGTYDKSGNLDIWLTESNSSTYTDKMVLLKANTEYTVSAKIIEGTISNTNTLMRISSRSASDKTFGWNYQSMTYSNGEYKVTFTPTNDIYLGAIRIPLSSDITISFDKVILKIQVEVGSSSTNYVSYFTPIELNKIGTYDDRIYKDNGKWYIYKEIGKIILDETTIFYNFRNVNNTYVNANYTNANLFKILSSNNEVGCISNKLLGTNVASTYGGSKLYSIAQAGNGNYLQLCLPYSEATSYSEVNEWISNNNPIVYYILETPTTTEITNTELIEQLESLYNAKSKNGTTNITITSQDLAMIMGVNVIKGDA